MPTNAEIHEVVLIIQECLAAQEADDNGLLETFIDKHEMPYAGDDWDY